MIPRFIGLVFGKAAVKSQKEVELLINKYVLELKTAMFGVGVENINELQRVKLEKFS